MLSPFTRDGWRLTGICVLCLLASCVDSDYDLKNDLDLSVGIGGDYLALPLGNTEAIPLERIIKTENSDLLHTDAAGNYLLLKQDVVSMETDPIDPVMIQVDPHIFNPITLAFDGGPLPPQGEKSEVHPSVWVDEESVEQIDTSLPTQVKEIEWMEFQQSVHALLEIQVSGSTASVRKLKFEDFKLIFPDYVSLAETGINEITIGDEFLAAEGYVRSFRIERLNFDQNPVEDARMRLSVPVRLEGKIVVSEFVPGQITAGSVILDPTLTLSDMEVGLIQGRIDPQVSDTHHQVDLTDMPDFLQGDDVVFDVQPRLTLVGENTLGMVLDVDLQAVPWQNGNPVQEGINELYFMLDAAPVPGEVTASRLWLAASDEDVPEEYRYVEALRLPQLLRKVPDQIDLQFQVEPDPSQPQQLDLRVEQYPLNLNYELNIPLSFGPSLQLCYRDTIRDLIKEIGEVTDKVSLLEIVSEATNTIPLELICQAIPVDANLQPLEGVEVSVPATIQPGGRNGEEVRSPFEITIRETTSGALSALDGLILEVTGKGNESVAQIPLNSSQYLQFTMKCKIPGGLHVDIDDL